jgi:hypothetical protein
MITANPNKNCVSWRMAIKVPGNELEIQFGRKALWLRMIPVIPSN